MPIDLYKLTGLDYRDKTRESKLAVDADVERARRIAEQDIELQKKTSKELEGVARKRFVENYAKTLEAGGQTEGIGEDAEAAWAKKVASGDLKDVMQFEEAAGKMPHIRDLAKEKIQADQQDIEVKKEENKSKIMSLISLVGAMVGMGGLGGIGGAASGAGGSGGGGLLKSLSGSKSSGSELEKMAGDKLKAGGAQSRAAFSLAEKQAAENNALLPDAGSRALTQAEQEQADRELRLSGQRLGNQVTQNNADIGRRAFMGYDQDERLRHGLQEQQLRSLELENQLNEELGVDTRKAIIEQRRAAAAAAKARAGGMYNTGLAGQSLGAPVVPPRRLTADELDIVNIR